MRNMIDLAKAIRYAEKFVSKNKARPVFNYIFIKDGEVISSDTYFVIKCEVGGKQEPQLINPKGTELLAEPEKYPDVHKFFQTKGFTTSVTFYSDKGLRESFKKLAVIFDTCKKLTTKKELYPVFLKVKGNKLWIFSGEDEFIFFEYSVAVPNKSDDSTYESNIEMAYACLNDYIKYNLELWKPQYGETYYTPDPFRVKMYVMRKWINQPCDEDAYARGIVFKTWREARDMCVKMTEYARKEVAGTGLRL